MLYTDMTKRALMLCFEAHKEQLDKSGMPYVFHPFHLAEQMPDEDCTVVALLHDVMEDMEITRPTGSEKHNACVIFLLRLRRLTVEQLVARMNTIEGVLSVEEL